MKGSSENIEEKTLLKKQEHTENANGKMDSGNAGAKKRKFQELNKANEPTKAANEKMATSLSTNHNRNVSYKIFRSCHSKPTLGEILNPGYLERKEAAIADKDKRKLEAKKRRQLRNAEFLNQISDSWEIKETDIKETINEDVKSKKKLLIFDVNGLLADIVSPRPQDVKADIYIPKRAVFKRPFLEDFLRFCFNRFKVAIWSSRTTMVLDPVVNFLFRDLKKNLLFIWDASRCSKTGSKTIEDKHKPMVFKDLRKLWKINGPDDAWLKGNFDESNTLLLDDSPYKALLNPKHTAIFPPSYSYKNRNEDDSLGPNGDLRKYLQGLAASDDVRTYVDQHPFGQTPIDETHPSWPYYARVLKGQQPSQVFKLPVKVRLPQTQNEINT